MGKRGAKPQAVEIKRERGVFRNNRDAKFEVVGRVLDTIPYPPEDMKEHGTKLWFDFFTYALEIKGYIATIEIRLVEKMCDAYQTWKASKLQLDEEGTTIMNDKGVMMINPAFKVQQTAFETYFKISKELGLTPSTRGGVQLIQQKKAGDFDDL